jgi:hypothetical protein
MLKRVSKNIFRLTPPTQGSASPVRCGGGRDPSHGHTTREAVQNTLGQQQQAIIAGGSPGGEKCRAEHFFEPIATQHIQTDGPNIHGKANPSSVLLSKFSALRDTGMSIKQSNDQSNGKGKTNGTQPWASHGKTTPKFRQRTIANRTQ